MKKKKSSVHSFAGSCGAASRWANHTKVYTTHIRIKKHDRDYLSTLASAHSVSVVDLVSMLCKRLRSREISLFST